MLKIQFAKIKFQLLAKNRNILKSINIFTNNGERAVKKIIPIEAITIYNLPTFLNSNLLFESLFSASKAKRPPSFLKCNCEN